MKKTLIQENLVKRNKNNETLAVSHDLLLPRPSCRPRCSVTGAPFWLGAAKQLPEGCCISGVGAGHRAPLPQLQPRQQRCCLLARGRAGQRTKVSEAVPKGAESTSRFTRTG